MINHIGLKLINDKKIFITGGTGFFGKNLLKYLIQNNITPQQITVLTRDKVKFVDKYPELQAKWLDYQIGDIRNLTHNGAEYDYFIHAAASVVHQECALTNFDEIVNGTRKALEFADKSFVKTFINISSGAVYSTNRKLIGLSEDSQLISDVSDEKNTYGLAKIAGEHLAYLFSCTTKMKIVSLRCFCFAGSYLESKYFAIGEFVQKAIKNQDIEVRAGHGIFRSYMAMDDLARLIFSVMLYTEKMQQNYDVFNVGASDARNLPDIAELIIKLLGSSSKIVQVNPTNELVNYYVPNVNKISKIVPVSVETLLDVIMKFSSEIHTCI